MRLFAILSALVVAPLARAQTSVQAPPAASGAASRPQAPQTHWAQRLGLRSLQVMRATPLVDRVVLVPDAATYADEIRKWSPRGRWPVLFEDDQFAPMFVRRFAPAQLIRREAATAKLPDDALQRRRELESIVVGSLGGDPASQTITQVFDLAKYKPPGVVVASTNDPAWPAALALAAGHAQPLVWIDEDFGAVNGELDDAAAHKLAAQIDTAIDALHYSYRALGDDIDAITLCRNLPVAARIGLPQAQRMPVTGQYAEGATALTDFLGRNADGSRYAFTGWIFGDEKRCAYMAMCSLFLPRDNTLLLNTYNSEGEWGQYTMSGAADTLAKIGFTVAQHAGPADMGEAGWRRLLIAGLSADVVWMNSGGGADYFILNGGQARAGDVPLLNAPAALHLIHSWSLRWPAKSGTVGERWLAHGAYAMVGSCYEPFLSAFIPPQLLANRCAAAMPFLIAARRWAEDGMAMPWRLVTIGDPLMLIPPAAMQKITRFSQPADYGVDLLARVKETMKAADQTGDIAAFVESIHVLDMLGKDDIAIGMWRLAQQKNMHSGRVASVALPALFRRSDAEGFLQAWNEGGPRTPLMLDMLWHVMGPRLGGTSDRDLLVQMEAVVRPDDPASDVERLAAPLMHVLGKDHARQFVEREIARTRDGEQQQRLREIAKKY